MFSWWIGWQVELSSQGDNFTQQIWLMYGQFEQVVDRFNPPIPSPLLTAAGAVRPEDRHWPPRPDRRSVRHRHRHRHDKTVDQSKMSHQINQISRVVQPTKPFIHSSSSSTTTTTTVTTVERFDLSDSDSESEPEVPSRMTRGLYASRATGQRPGLNPLLETISVIGDLCDSDDAVDGSPATGLYAGSNSVDSGYKSSCPTPDLAQDASNYISGRPPVLKSRRTLPAIPAIPVATTAPTAAAGHNDTRLDLDHLTSLRRTLLTAIERYDTRTKELDRDLINSVVTTERRHRSVSPKGSSASSISTGVSDASLAADRSCRLGHEMSTAADQVLRCVLSGGGGGNGGGNGGGDQPPVDLGMSTTKDGLLFGQFYFYMGMLMSRGLVELPTAIISTEVMDVFRQRLRQVGRLLFLKVKERRIDVRESEKKGNLFFILFSLFSIPPIFSFHLQQQQQQHH